MPSVVGGKAEPHPSQDPDLFTISPSYPTTCDNVTIAVSFLFGSSPPHVDEFGPIERTGSTFSVTVAVYYPAPGDIVLFIVHTDSHTYGIGRLAAGQYTFTVYVQRLHFMEGLFLAGTLHFNVTFPGDVDHDLDVDIFDAVKCGIAYGATPQDANWNPYCDIAEPHEVIDIFDLVALAGNYGEKCTP